jgi:hypothetical protein
MNKWKITSPNGQILYGELEDNMVNMSSTKGNHGQVTLAVWSAKVEQMRIQKYTVEAI